MIELMFWKVLMFIRQVHLKNLLFSTIGIFLHKGFKFQMDICNESHDVLIMPNNLNSFAVLDVHGFDYCCIVNGISQRKTINLFLKC